MAAAAPAVDQKPKADGRDRPNRGSARTAHNRVRKDALRFVFKVRFHPFFKLFKVIFDAKDGIILKINDKNGKISVSMPNRSINQNKSAKTLAARRRLWHNFSVR